MGELIMMLFHARTSAHVLHLKTRSYAAHVALQEFYEGLVSLADTLAEVYQGAHGLIESFPARYTPYTDPIELLKAVKTSISECRYEHCSKSETHLQNIIDEIVALTDSTLYKLQNLK